MLKHSKFVTRPLYLQVRDLLVQRVVTGEWGTGAPLPNETALAQELNISVGTIRKALDTMEEEGIVVRKQGRGTFVNDQTTSEMSIRLSSIANTAGVRLQGTTIARRVDHGLASREEADRLDLVENQPVVRVDRVHLDMGRPYMREHCVLPAQRFAKLPADLGSYRICVLAQANSIFLDHAVEEVRAVLPDAEAIGDLAVSADEPLLKLDRVVYAISGKPVEWRVGTCHLRDQHYLALVQ